MILAEWAPLLAVLGISPAMAAAARAPALARAHAPAVALPLWLASYYVWHIPAVYDAALAPPELADPPRARLLLRDRRARLVAARPGRAAAAAERARAGYAFAAFVLAAPLGLLLALLPRPIYGYYVAPGPRVWGLSPLADQELAGVTMAAEQALVLFAVFAYWFRRFLAEEGRYLRQPVDEREVGVARVRCQSVTALP